MLWTQRSGVASDACISWPPGRTWNGVRAGVILLMTTRSFSSGLVPGHNFVKSRAGRSLNSSLEQKGCHPLTMSAMRALCAATLCAFAASEHITAECDASRVAHYKRVCDLDPHHPWFARNENSAIIDVHHGVAFHPILKAASSAVHNEMRYLDGHDFRMVSPDSNLRQAQLSCCKEDPFRGRAGGSRRVAAAARGQGSRRPRERGIARGRTWISPRRERRDCPRRERGMVRRRTAAATLISPRRERRDCPQ